jgi:hypothetical protein
MDIITGNDPYFKHNTEIIRGIYDILLKRNSLQENILGKENNSWYLLKEESSKLFRKWVTAGPTSSAQSEYIICLSWQFLN